MKYEKNSHLIVFYFIVRELKLVQYREGLHKSTALNYFSKKEKEERRENESHTLIIRTHSLQFEIYDKNTTSQQILERVFLDIQLTCWNNGLEKANYKKNQFKVQVAEP